jgi:hypothetical protein
VKNTGIPLFFVIPVIAVSKYPFTRNYRLDILKLNFEKIPAISLLGEPLENILARHPSDLFGENIRSRLGDGLQNNIGAPIEIDQKHRLSSMAGSLRLTLCR